jgi:hypothetical protein
MSAELAVFVAEIAALGRTDVIAIRMADGGYRPLRLQGPIPRSMITDHLNGKQPLGMYLVTGDMAQVGAIDLDDHGDGVAEARLADLAASACRYLIENGCKPFPVRSGGGRGAHVFVFFRRPQPARRIRRLLARVLSDLALSSGTAGVASGVAEVFPKQDKVDEGGFGNLIALPFARKSQPLNSADGSPVPLNGYVPPKLEDRLSDDLPASEDASHVLTRDAHAPLLPGDDEQARAALKAVPSDDYHAWIRVGLALKHVFGDDGFDIWLEWSRKSSRFRNEEDCRDKWRGFKPLGRVGLGTIFHMAQERGWNGPSNPLLREMNARFGILAAVNQPMIILKNGERRPDDETVMISTRSFFERMKAEPLPPPPGGGSPANKGKVWMDDPLAARYHGVDFDPHLPPGHNGRIMNLWRGFAIEPRPGSWARLQDHLYENVSGADDRTYGWFLNWLAFGVQRLGEVPGTAPVLIGPPGVGKGFLANAYGAIWGSHYVAVTHYAHVFGRFNHHLVARRVVFVDEGLFGGNRREAGVMKARITEPFIVLEQKGIDPIKIRNRAMYMIASNEASVVPADLGDRRWMVVRVKAKRREDHKYFGAIADELQQGGYAAMLHDLLIHDISRGPDPTITIKGPELSLQILRAQPFYIQYFHRVLDEGRLPQNTVAGPSVTTIRALHADMKAQHPEARYLNDNALGRHLRDLFPEIRSNPGGSYIVRVENGVNLTERSTTYYFPRLIEARRIFEDSIGAPIEWSNDLQNWLSDVDDYPV